ncbi:MAG: tRNA glutamyl-Q(34) synthetase GluQRS [Propionibacteriaceae bacterium]|jgi:glutamyl-tRNA synthetase|nr:tRNA glutamyl-Q(34) synthetase GluQRS [Propionibacteriaceae bacterium]
MTGRFAPTPTSDLHVGNLRTALVAWLAARASGSDFLIRVEDLDVTRLRDAEAITARQLSDIATLGLDHDGDIVRQSRRFGLYERALAGLKTYECFCSRKDVAEATMAPHGATPFYPGTCRDLTPAQRARKRETRVPCLRVDAGAAKTSITDLLHGEVSGVVDDFVVRRADGVFAYNLAVVVDDQEQGIDQVLRGDDLLESAPRQAWLATQLGYTPPTYLHVPLVLAPDGTRLAKRDNAAGLSRLLERGLAVPAIVGILAASLGLAKTGEELDARDLVERFDPKALPHQAWLTDPDSW